VSAPIPAPKATDLPTQVFEQFLIDLVGAGIPAEVVARLRKTLLEDRVFTDAALKQAVLGEETAP